MSEHDSQMQLDTLTVHGGQHVCPQTGAVMPPVYLSSTYAQTAPGEHQGFEYSRSHNPTRYALERCIARLEGSALDQSQDVSFGGFAFSSGLAATATLLDTLKSGDHVIAMDDLYGGTHRLFRQVINPSRGIDFTFVDMTDLDAIEAAVTDRTRLLWVETPTNPMLKISDLQAIADRLRGRGILLACDNTFATPMLQRPLTMGFDVVMHSGTKYIGGHSDVVCGMLVTSDQAIAERIRFHQNAVGSVLGPFDSYLALRGAKTMALRMQRHCDSALRIAQLLEASDKVAQVIYPGLPSHPQADVARRQMCLGGTPAGGGMITATLETDLAGSRRFLEAVQVFALAESLGGVESLIEHPAIMTHASVPPEHRAALGIGDALVRLSVGIESPDDLCRDVERALAAV
ncbi:MAG: PLP-dependent aspartate aminotransferase family protein [Phycisphaerales bacterium]|nr:PLP-dependent aspartate aminotransferase family protein [Phycisphaerales bacterium]